jgi:predicted nuclease of restriction endonuclease-like (RecB) superfamily
MIGMQGFPAIKGFPVRNPNYMRKFAETWREISGVQELLAQITWYHHIALLDKLKDPADREWYIHETIRSLRCRNRTAS